MDIAEKFFLTIVLFALLGPVIGLGLFAAYGFVVMPDFFLDYNPTGDVLSAISEFGAFAMIAGVIFSGSALVLSKYTKFVRTRVYRGLIGAFSMALVFSLPFFLDLFGGYGIQTRELIFALIGGLSGFVLAALLPRRLVPCASSTDA